jgi:3-oxoacyl-[acyl-carrier-protein] synthase I
MSSLPVRAVVQGAGAICSIGYSLPQIWATVRASISSYAFCGLLDRHGEPFRMAMVDDQELELMAPENDLAALTMRERRMVRLAAPALREAVAGLELRQAPPLFLGLPRPAPNSQPTSLPVLVATLARQAGVPLAESASSGALAGRAAFFLALEQGLRFLASGRGTVAIVGAVDSHLDLRLLAELDAQRRLLGEGVSDGFIPGEGAGFLVLARAAVAPKPRTTFCAGAGLAKDPGHRHGDAPALGEGLWLAMNALLATTPLGKAQLQTVFAGLNGESFGAKEWGLARLRHQAAFSQQAPCEHPADCYGDVGAATGALLAGLAHASLAATHRQGPVLVWASSDHEERGCAILDITPP